MRVRPRTCGRLNASASGVRRQSRGEHVDESRGMRRRERERRLRKSKSMRNKQSVVRTCYMINLSRGHFLRCDDVHGIRLAGIGRDVLSRGRLETAGEMVVRADDPNVIQVPRGGPNGHGFGGEASIRETHDRRATRFQHSAHFFHDFQRSGEVVDAHRVRDDVKGIVRIRKRRIFVQVPDGVIG